MAPPIFKPEPTDASYGHRFLNWASPYPPEGQAGKMTSNSNSNSGSFGSLRRKTGELPPVPAQAYAGDVKSDRPALEEHPSEADLAEALRRSELEANEQQQREDDELQQAMRASQLDKGKGRAFPSRQSSMDDEEMQTAMALSASEEKRSRYNDEEEFDEEAQRRELQRFEQARASMFDTNDASSLSIISERTEADTPAIEHGEEVQTLPRQPTSNVGEPGHTPLIPREEPPSYFNLWRTQDAKPYMDEKERMAVLPPLSSMMANAPGAPRSHDKRPLPPIPGSASASQPGRPSAQPNIQASFSFDSNFAPDEHIESDVDGSSVRTVRSPNGGVTQQQMDNYFASAGNNARTDNSNSPEQPTTPTPSNQPQSNGRTSTSRSPPSTADASTRSSVTSESSIQAATSHLTSPETTDDRPHSPAPFSSYTTVQQSNNSSESQPPLPTTSTQSTGEIVWPSTNLPPGARVHRPHNQTQDSTANNPPIPDDEEAFNTRAIRYGFFTDSDPTLPYSRDTDSFPDVVQLSHEDDCGVFAMEAPTWAGLLRFLNLNGDTRIEAHPRDIQNEKVGHGETEIAARFVKSSSGSGESVVRLIIRLLPPVTTREGRVVSPHTTVPSKTGEAPRDVAMPDHLVLPIKLADVGSMLFTLRHLASIAVATYDPKKPSKRKSLPSSYDTLLALGQRINQLAFEHAPKDTSQDKSPVRLRDRLKAKLGGK